jgi:hypothetical protein
VSAGRPLTKAERKAFNRAKHEQKIKQDLIAQHGNELGQFYYWLRVANMRGTQTYHEGNPDFVREVALALHNVYSRHFG